jgi:hypothetical protein
MPSSAEIEFLLSELCTKLGFCLPADEQARLCKTPPEDVDVFTKAVFLAEGFDLETVDKHLYRKVRERVAEAFQRSSIKHA